MQLVGLMPPCTRMAVRLHNKIYYIYVKYFTCTYVRRHDYEVIGVYKILHGAGRVSYFTEPAILWLDGTVMEEVGARNI